MSAKHSVAVSTARVDTKGKGRSGKGGRGKHAVKTEEDVAAMVEAGRAALLSEKQAELDRIENRHDDLVRSQYSILVASA